MEKLKEVLKDFGWSENLINASVGKQFDTISTPNYYKITPQFIDTPTVIVSTSNNSKSK